jgi:hypothetical protein
MAGERDLDALIGSMEPTVRPGRFVFVTVDAGTAESLPAEIVVRETEGVTVVLVQSVADARSLPYDFVAGWITLQVHSALDAVGLTAAFSTALAEHGISANVVAGYYHDHLLVPIDDVDRALAALRELAANRRPK